MRMNVLNRNKNKNKKSHIN